MRRRPPPDPNWEWEMDRPFRERAQFVALLRARAAEALADPAPDVHAEEVIAAIDTRHEARAARGA